MYLDRKTLNITKEILTSTKSKIQFMEKCLKNKKSERCTAGKCFITQISYEYIREIGQRLRNYFKGRNSHTIHVVQFETALTCSYKLLRVYR